VLFFITFILLSFIGCVTTKPGKPIPGPKQEPTATSTKEKLKVHFIKMERFGDAILIDLGKTEILIDGGFGNSGVATYLQNYVDGPLEAMVVTHPHPDHFGGLIEVLVNFEVNQIWLNGDHFCPAKAEPMLIGLGQDCHLPKLVEAQKALLKYSF
jgi:competence protein ComEC